MAKASAKTGTNTFEDKHIYSTEDSSIKEDEIDGSDQKVSRVIEFDKSSFSSLETIKTPNGRCRRGFLKDGGEAVFLKTISAKSSVKMKELEISRYIPLHQNVLPLLGIFTEDSMISLVSLCQDDDLLNWVQRREYQHEQWCDISIQMGNGLAHLHQHNIIHRDVALRNYLIKKQPTDINIKICDFELSRVIPCDDAYRFDVRKIEVPWAHSAFEVLYYGCFETQSDVHSFGISIWELLKRGKEPIEHRTRDLLVSALQRYSSAVPLLDDVGIPLKIILLIECCTKFKSSERPNMADVISYLEQCQADKLYFENIPGYFQEVIRAKKTWPKVNEVPYSEIKNEILDIDAEYDNDEELGIFFKKLLNPGDKPLPRKDIDRYTSMCYEDGVYYKSELKECLFTYEADDLIDNEVFFRQFHYRKIAMALFDLQYAEFEVKMKKVLKYQNEEKSCAVRLRMPGDLPESDRGKEQFMDFARQSGRNNNILFRVDQVNSGSILMTILMTAGNLKRFQEKLDDTDSNFHSTGNIFSSATIIEKNSFRYGSIALEERLEDVFGFGGVTTAENASDYTRKLFESGIYQTDELMDFLGEQNDVDGLTLMGFSQSGISHIKTCLDLSDSLSEDGLPPLHAVPPAPSEDIPRGAQLVAVSNTEHAKPTSNYEVNEYLPGPRSTHTSRYRSRNTDGVTIIIHNLAKELQEIEYVKKTFGKYGPIYKCNISKSGAAFVQYTNGQDANTAVEDTNGEVLRRHKIEVAIHCTSSAFGSLRVESMADEWDELKLSKRFRVYGELSNTFVQKQAKGNLGFVDFVIPDDAMKAKLAEDKKRELFCYLIFSMKNYQEVIPPHSQKKSFKTGGTASPRPGSLPISPRDSSSRSSSDSQKPLCRNHPGCRNQKLGTCRFHHPSHRRGVGAELNESAICPTYLQEGICKRGRQNCVWAHPPQVKGAGQDAIKRAPRPKHCRNSNCASWKLGRCAFVHRDQSPRVQSPYAQSDEGKEAPRKIHVKNLDEHTTEGALVAQFYDYGVESCKIVSFPDGTSKGYGFITLKSPKIAADLVARRQIDVGRGRLLQLSWATRQ